MRTVPKLILALLCLIRPAPPRAGAAEPVAYLLAPKPPQAFKSDLLVPEAALRLLSAELAARHGLYAPYYSVDQLDRVDEDARPRLQPRRAYTGFYPHIRLSRRGDLFSFYAGKNGETWWEHGRVRLPMPKRTYVGLWAYCRDHGKRFEAVLARPMLNGEPLTDLKGIHIGDRPRDNVIAREGDAWRLANTCYSTYGDQRERCPFVYTTHEGDFDLDVYVQTPPPDPAGGTFAWAGVMCRADLARDAAAVSMASYGHAQMGVLCLPELRRVAGVTDSYSPIYGGPIWPQQGEQVWLTRVGTRSYTWVDLLESTRRMADQLRADLLAKAGLEAPGDPVPAAPATPEQLAALDEARRLAFTGMSGKILQASGMVDEVLNASPTCPEAHYAASLMGALLAAQDLRGTFHQRPRFLARPVAHYLLARQLARPARQADRLTEVWLMVACGFPAEAADALDAITGGDDLSAEHRALRMFATRDYRPYDAQSIRRASPFEQLAWLWAAQYCKFNDAVRALGAELAQTRRSFAFMPIYTAPNRAYKQVDDSPIPGIRTAFARDAFDLLMCDRLDEDERDAIGADIAAELNARLEPGHTTRDLARAVAWTASNHLQPDALREPLTCLNELYMLAMNQPAGPVSRRADGALQWHSLGVHGFADLQRGLLMRALYLRAWHMGKWRRQREQAKNFCEAVADGLADTPGIAAFFLAYGAMVASDASLSGEELKVLQDKDFGASQMLRCLLVHDWPLNEYWPMIQMIFPQGNARGAWDLAEIALAAQKQGRWQLALIAGMRCAANDPWGHESAVAISSATREASAFDRVVAKAPYNAQALGEQGRWAKWFDDVTRAANAYRGLIAMSGEFAGWYKSLAELYAEHGDLDRAVEIAAEARSKCKPSNDLTDLTAQAACRLAELGRIDEALGYGRAAKAGNRYLGHVGWARALEAAGRSDEALAAYTQFAHRYNSGISYLLEHMLRTGRTADEISRRVESVLDEHTYGRESVAENALRVLITSPGCHKMLDPVLKGPLAFVDRAEQLPYLMLSGMYSRQFADVLVYSKELAGLTDRNGGRLIWTWIAAKFAGREDVATAVQAELARAGDDKQVGHAALYLAGRIDRAEMLSRVQSAANLAYASWVLGVEAELAGDLPTALKHYKTAADCPVNLNGRKIPRTWLRTLTASPATAPAASR